MAESNAGLLIAALVAIVAVVGLVILFKGGSSTGADAFRVPMSTCPGNYWIHTTDAETPTGYWYCSTTGARSPYNPDQQVYLR